MLGATSSPPATTCRSGRVGTLRSTRGRRGVMEGVLRIDFRDGAVHVSAGCRALTTLMASVDYAARAATPAPILSPAPGRFSITNCWPSRSDFVRSGGRRCRPDRRLRTARSTAQADWDRRPCWFALRSATDKQRQADRCCDPFAHVWSSITK
jgi:hypothetical protein